MRNAVQERYSGLTPLSFILDMIFILNPVSMLIWVPGIIFYFFNKSSRIFRPLGYIWLVTFIILLINWHSKAEYITPAFQILFAGGSIMIVKWNARKKNLKYAVVIPVVVLNIIFSTYGRPVLSPENFLAFQNLVNLKPPDNEGRNTEMPPFYADMFGWEELAKNVSKVYQSLPDEEKKHTVVYCNNYGEAGAIEYYSKKFPLPKVICPHNSYWYWWPEISTATTVIIIGGEAEQHLDAVEQCDLAAIHKTKYAMPYENNLKIFIGRGLKIPLHKIKQELKHFI
jgi:hypothetical protein